MPDQFCGFETILSIGNLYSCQLPLRALAAIADDCFEQRLIFGLNCPTTSGYEIALDFTTAKTVRYVVRSAS